MDGEFHQIVYYFKVIHNTFRSKLNMVLREYDLTKPQLDILVYLEEARRKDERVIQKDLESFFHISNSTVSVMLDRLESKELISRERAEDGDRRVRYVYPTEKANDLHAAVVRTLNATESEMFDGLSQEELACATRFLQKILCNLTGKENPPDDQRFDEADPRV